MVSELKEFLNDMSKDELPAVVYFILGLSKPEKEEIMDMGMRAANAMHELISTSVR
jgi:hypothetical protein